MECPICLSLFDDPRLLPCGHTYCLKCLQQLGQVGQSSPDSDSASIDCPKCRRNIPYVRRTNVASLPRNYAVLELLNEMCQKHADGQTQPLGHEPVQPITLLPNSDADHQTIDQSEHSEQFSGASSPVPGVSWDAWNWFKAVDQDNRGGISLEELKLALLNFDMTAFNDKTCQLLFSTVDTDENGVIDVREFAELLDYVREWKSKFDQADLNHSGNIDARELHLCLNCIGFNASLEQAQRIVGCLQPMSGIKSSAHQAHGEHVAAINFDDFLRCCVSFLKVAEEEKRDPPSRVGPIPWAMEENEFLCVLEKLNSW